MICSKCHADKPITQYYMGKRLDPVCKQCRRDLANDRRLKIKQVEDEAKRQMELIFGKGLK